MSKQYTPLNAIVTASRFGALRSIQSTWSAARDAATATDSDSADVGCFAYLAAGSYFIRRGFVSYDMSVLPTATAIESIDLNLYIPTSAFDNIDSDTFYVVEGSQSNPITTADFDAVTFTSLGSKTLASISLDAYNVFSLNATGIALVQSKVKSQSVLNLAHIMGRDFNNNAPSGESNQARVSIPTDANPPYMTINYRLPLGASVF